MSRFVTQVKIAGSMSRTDINHVSEDVLLPLFREIYGYTGLENLNKSEGPNFPAIDLGDKETGIAYQITSKADSQKIKGTLKKFVNHKLYEQYNRLAIYCLTEKQKTYQGRGFDEIIQGKFSFDKENDILDYQDLINEISGFSLEKSRKVEDILEQHFGELGMDESERDIHQLSDTAKILLKEASQDRRVLYLQTHRETSIQINGKNMIPDQDHRVVAQWEAALKELEDAGLLERKGDKGETFDVTARGYEIADTIEYYQATESFNEQIEQRFAAGTKPLVLTEGPLDVHYIRAALTVLGKEELLNAFDIKFVGIKEGNRTRYGGDTGLNNFRNVYEANSSLFHRPILLLYDCDTRKPEEQVGQLWVRSIPCNPENTKVKNGIENLFPEDLFEDRFYSERPTNDGGFLKQLDKTKFCDWICETQKDANDFVKFDSIVQILKEFRSPSVPFSSTGVTIRN